MFFTKGLWEIKLILEKYLSEVQKTLEERKCTRDNVRKIMLVLDLSLLSPSTCRWRSQAYSLFFSSCQHSFDPLSFCNLHSSSCSKMQSSKYLVFPLPQINTKSFMFSFPVVFKPIHSGKMEANANYESAYLDIAHNS